MEREIRWSAPEFHYHEKDIVWYWMVFIAAIILIALALWQGNFLFAVFVIVAAMLVTAWGKKTPDTVNVTLSEHGLDIGEKRRYAFNELLGFAIVQDDHNHKLAEFVVRTKGRLGSWIKIIIARQRTEAIRALASSFIPEIEYEPSFTDHLARWLRF